MLGEIGEFFGNIIVVCYVLTILNFVVKFINKNYRNVLIRNESLYTLFKKAMKFIVQRHKIFGFLTILFILIHFYLQYIQYGMKLSGLIAATVMLLQIGLGIYGSKMKKKSKAWLFVHRAIAILLLVTIIIHVA